MNAVVHLRQTFRPVTDWLVPLMNELKTNALASSSAKAEQLARNQFWFRQILRSQRRDKTCLPHFLGLSTSEFHWMAAGKRYRLYDELLHDTEAERERQASDLRQQLLEMRLDEWEELRNLLLGHRANNDDSEVAIASVVAAGCLGGGHLWRDLGLVSRQELNDLLSANFPVLAARNDRDMKWKKFFYKQLCELGGGYVCRAPSCDQCSAYSDCFGPET